MSDSETSSSDNFEDAVESVEVSQSPRSRAKRNTMKRGERPPAGHEPSPVVEDKIEILTGDQVADNDGRWRRLENLRRRGEVGGGEDSPGQESPLNVTSTTPADSRESSVEGIYLSGVRSHHPFKVVECDSRSVQSDSKSHRSSVSDVRQSLIPDIVSSTKTARVTSVTTLTTPVTPTTSITTSDTVMGPPSLPLAPPRRKKTSTTTTPLSDSKAKISITEKPSQSPEVVKSPGPASKLVSQDVEQLSVHNLNLSSATRGDFVVRPQDDESRRGEQERKVSAELVSVNQDPAGGVTVEEPAGAGGGGRGSLGRVKSGGSGGYHSGGSGGQHSNRSQALSGRGSAESRKSGAGSGGSDGGMVKQMGLFVRTKSDSGKRLTDQQILQQIKVRDLDTGTEMDLAAAENLIPRHIDPMSKHIIRITGEYTGTHPADGISVDSDRESLDSRMSDFDIGQAKKRSFNKIVGSLSKSARSAAKLITEEVSRRHRTKEEKEEEKLGRLATDITNTDGVKVVGNAANDFKRIQAHKSGPTDFQNIQFGQDLSGHHQGPVWCMKFSLCGRLLATAGQDCILRIWVLRDKYQYFHDMRRRYQVETEGLPVSGELRNQDEAIKDYLSDPDSAGHIFMERPFVTYTGHTSDLLDVSWSKNFFILTSSMDKTVRLWHISRQECLCIFQHIDFVTAIVFHPKNDQFFISGSLDGKIRLWNIPDKKVTLWNEISGTSKLITTAAYCQNGKFVVVGTYDGRVIFFSTDQLKYHTTIHVQSSRSKNGRGRKVTGIEPMPSEDRILITSNDSRIRLYDLRDLSMVCKYKGYTNLASQIKACFSPDGRYICAGSENQCVFLWSTNHIPQAITARKDRNNYYEAIKAHGAVVTCSLFAPVPNLLLEAVARGKEPGAGMDLTGEVVVSGDFEGDIKVFINRRNI